MTKIVAKLATWFAFALAGVAGNLIVFDQAIAACIGSSPNWTAASPSRTDVGDCVNSANDGDTVNVPQGAAVWTSALTIRKNISLIGAGIGNTTITSGVADTLLTYSPASNGKLFRISGFTFDANNRKILALQNNSFNPPIYQVRVDHNRFTNSTIVGGAIENFGTRGVADHNVFDGMRGPTRAWGTNVSAGTFEWNNYPELVFGAANDNFYYEDNTFTLTGSVYMISDCDQGGRYVFRYNSFNSQSDVYPWLDFHGGRGSLRGCFAGEVYGNIYSRGGLLVSWRGGRVAFFLNSVSSGSGTFNVYTNDGCPMEQKERHNNGYAWLNRAGLKGALIKDGSTGGDNCGDVVRDSTYHIDRAPFDGSSGVGAGTLAQRPANCTTGTAYWASDQSVADMTGMVGPNPTAPITGTLFKCASTNSWVRYFTPFTYPHPLTQSANATGNTLPSPTNLRVQ